MEIVESPFAGFLGGILYGISYEEIIRPICLALWSLLFLVPLVKIDLTDLVTASTFILFSMASAFLVVLAVPMKLTPTDSLDSIISVGTVAIVFGSAKWWLSYRKQKILRDKKMEQERQLLI